MVNATVAMLTVNITDDSSDDDIMNRHETFESFLNHFGRQHKDLLPQGCVDLYDKVTVLQFGTPDSGGVAAVAPVVAIAAVAGLVMLALALEI